MHRFIKEGVPVQLQVVLVDHLRFLILPQVSLVKQHLKGLFIFSGRGSVLIFLALNPKLIYRFMIGSRMLKHVFGIGVLLIERRPSSFMIIWRGKQKQKLGFAL